ncbi:MAG: glycoside hydrolase family 9 protein [Verrucomicrobia bacterium]|nr:glycoside hydrolase family 9 protein [Verrucomicrobiota bacterium]
MNTKNGMLFSWLFVFALATAASSTVVLAAEPDLPPLQRWNIGRIDGSSSEFGKGSLSRGEGEIVVRCGIDDAAKLPLAGMKLGKFGKAVRFQFNLAQGGLHTFRVAASDVGSFSPGYLCVSADGKEVYKRVVTGLIPYRRQPFEGGARFEEGLPLELAAGPHEIVVSVPTGWVLFDGFALEQGLYVPTHEFSAKEGIPEEMEFSNAEATRIIGKTFQIKVKDLTDGPCDVEMGFVEDLVSNPGERLFHVSVQGKRVADHFDVLAAAGGAFIPMTKRWPADIQGGTLTILFEGANAPALANWIAVCRAGKRIFYRALGFIEGQNPGYITPERLQPDLKRCGPIPSAPGTVHEANNLAPNPGFEVEQGALRLHAWRDRLEPCESKDVPPDQQRLPLGWNTLDQETWREGLWTQGQGAWSLDDRVHHGGKRSLRISGAKGSFGLTTRIARHAAMPILDYECRYRVSGWVKLENATGRSYLRLDWYRMVEQWLDHQERVDTTQPLSGTADWQKIELAVKPPYGAAAVRFSVVSEDNTGSVWFDDLHLDGYGSDPILLRDTQAGYSPDGIKSAVVWTTQDYPAGGRFELTDVQSGKNVFDGTLLRRGSYAWYDRYNWIADFSGHRTPGRYRLSVTFPNGPSVTGAPFEIKTRLYRDLAEFTLGYFHIISSGINVPGWHSACFLDDAVLMHPGDSSGSWKNKLPRRHLDATGSWYDAGDFAKHNLAWYGVYGMSCMMEGWDRSRDKLGGSLPDPLEVAWRVVRFYLNLQFPDGTFSEGVPTTGSKVGYVADAASLTDGKIGTEDDRVAAAATPAPSAVFVLGRFALAVKPFDAEKSQRVTLAAAKHYRGMTSYWDLHGGRATDGWRQLWFDPKVGLSALYLHELTGEERYAKDLEAKLTNVLTWMGKEVYFDPGYRPSAIAALWVGGEVGPNFDFDFVILLQEYLRLRPKGPQAAAARSELKRFCEKALVPLASRSPFNHLLEFKPLKDNPAEWMNPIKYATGYWQSAAAVFARSGRILQDRNLIELGELQLAYILGRSESGLCCLEGIGYRPFAAFTFLAGNPAHRDAVIPGGVVKDPCHGTGNFFFFGDPPKGFPIGWRHAVWPDKISMGSEYYQIFGGLQLWACWELHCAYK